MTARSQSIATVVKREAGQRQEGVRLSGATPLAAMRSPMAGTPEKRGAMIADEIGRQSVTPSPTESVSFTPREVEVMVLFASGLSLAQIGEAIHLSRHTVKNHGANAMRKAGVHTMVEAIHVAIREGAIR